MMTSEKGNKPLSAENYVAWPQLVEAINDKSRVYQCWCNGGEYFSYAGNTDDLNRVLKNFGDTQVPKLEVVILPHVASKKENDEPVDWRIEINAGVTEAMVKQLGLTSIRPLHPTLTVFVTKRIDVTKIVLPSNVIVSQLADIRKRCQDGQASDNKRLADESTHILKSLGTNRDAKAKKTYRHRTREIENFVDQAR